MQILMKANTTKESKQMKFPIEIFDSFYQEIGLERLQIGTDTGKLASLSKEDAFIRLLELADELEDVFIISSVYGADYEMDERSPITITLKWSEEDGYEAYVQLEYNIEMGDIKWFPIDLLEVPIRELKEGLKMPDYDRVLEAGIEIANENFDIEKFNEQ